MFQANYLMALNCSTSTLFHLCAYTNANLSLIIIIYEVNRLQTDNNLLPVTY